MIYLLFNGLFRSGRGWPFCFVFSRVHLTNSLSILISLTMSQYIHQEASGERELIFGVSTGQVLEYLESLT